ncbi:MAG: CotH kinase family protein [Ruminococcus sp.]|nr:CotH kinase family protein [Ruminococcus sp.]
MTISSIGLSEKRNRKKAVCVMLSAAMCLNIASSGTVSVSAVEDEGYIVPRVYITTADGTGNTLIKEDGYILADIKVVDKNGSVVEGNGQVKVRGNTTAKGEKKPFTVKFEKKKNVAGMGGNKKWALLADNFDPTLLRNYVAFELAKELGLAYTPKHTFAELYMDGVFKGCYELTEPIDVKSNRVDLDTEGNKDFLLEYQSSRSEAGVTYIKADELRFEVVEPEEPERNQPSYIADTMNHILDVIDSRDYDEIQKVIDVDSFAAYFLLNDLYKTVDFGFSSVYYYYKDNVLYAGPAWDYDLSSGNTYDYHQKKLSTEGMDANAQLFTHLCRCPEFMYKVREVYAEHYDYITNIYAPGGQIDSLAETYKDVFKRNYTEAGWDVSKKYSQLSHDPQKTYQMNLEYFKKWLMKRNYWMSVFYCVSDEDYEAKYMRNLCSAPYVYSYPCENKAELSWTGVAGAQRYCVVGYVNGKWITIAEGSKNSCELTGLTPGYQYNVAVIAKIGGIWKRDYSQVITVSPAVPESEYPVVSSVAYNSKYHQAELKWQRVEGATKYAVAVKSAGKWKIQTITDATAYRSPKLKPGVSFDAVVCAYKDGVWDLNSIDSRVVRVTIK